MLRIPSPQPERIDDFLAEPIRKGDELTRDHEELSQDYNRRQRELNRRYNELTRSGDPNRQEMLKLAHDQINFDRAMRDKIEGRYEREKSLRDEACEDIQS